MPDTATVSTPASARSRSVRFLKNCCFDAQNERDPSSQNATTLLGSIPTSTDWRRAKLRRNKAAQQTRTNVTAISKATVALRLKLSFPPCATCGVPRRERFGSVLEAEKAG